VRAAHSLKGSLKIVNFSDLIERFQPENKVFIFTDSCYKPYTIEKVNPLKDKMLIVKFVEINDRNIAEGLQGCELFITTTIAESTRQLLEQDDFYYYELIDCEVFHNNVLIGKVTDIMNAGGDVLIIENFDNLNDNLNNDKKKIMIPFVKDIVDTANISNKRLDINPPEGLLEI
jgi:16S rRNA processing protein RimM